MGLAVTFQDPGVYAKPWTFSPRAAGWSTRNCWNPICNEQSDDGQQHWVGKASDIERSQVKVIRKSWRSTRALQGSVPPRPRTVEVSLSGDSLFVAADGEVRKRPLISQSETSFTGTGLTTDSSGTTIGVATTLWRVPVSGDYKYARQK